MGKTDGLVLVRLFLLLVAGALIEDPRGGFVERLGEHEQVIGPEAGTFLPLLTIAIGARDGDVVHGTVAGLVLPNNRLHGAVSDNVAGLVGGAGGTCWSAVHSVSLAGLRHGNLLSK